MNANWNPEEKWNSGSISSWLDEGYAKGKFQRVLMKKCVLVMHGIDLKSKRLIL